jgi:hypothetical protein
LVASDPEGPDTPFRRSTRHSQTWSDHRQFRRPGKGYVIAPPSVHPDTGGTYHYLPGTHGLKATCPESLHAVLLNPPKPPAPKLNLGRKTSTKTSAKALGGLLDKVANEQEGNRQSVGFWAAKVLAENSYPITAWDLLEEAMHANGATPHDIKTALRDCPDGRYTRHV